jgi:biopolymer transport protein ExbD
MNFRSKKSKGRLSAIDITPLIDVMFNLLIFMFITTTFVQNPTLRIDLPKAETAPEQILADNVVIGLAADGQIFHQGHAVSRQALADRLAEVFARKQDATVIIQADSATPHGGVVEIMDLARQIGFTELAIATEKTPGQR